MAHPSHHQQYTNANKYQVQELEDHCVEQGDRLLPDCYVG